MPPEQIKDMRSAKLAADVFSAGATLYRLLSVGVPAGGVDQMIRQIMDKHPTKAQISYDVLVIFLNIQSAISTMIPRFPVLNPDITAAIRPDAMAT